MQLDIKFLETIYIYFAIRSLTHTTSASCLNDYSRHSSTKQLRHILGYVKLYYTKI